jgi:hypothetical protein
VHDFIDSIFSRCASISRNDQNGGGAREAKAQLSVATYCLKHAVFAALFKRVVMDAGLTFGIRKHVHEAGVDALTGKVLENKIEGPNAD